MKLLKNILKKTKNEDGQAIIEYSLISFMILGGGIAFLPSIIDQMVTAYHIYIGSFYYVLSLPIL